MIIEGLNAKSQIAAVKFSARAYVKNSNIDQIYANAPYYRYQVTISHGMIRTSVLMRFNFIFFFL